MERVILLSGRSRLMFSVMSVFGICIIAYLHSGLTYPTYSPVATSNTNQHSNEVTTIPISSKTNKPMDKTRKSLDEVLKAKGNNQGTPRSKLKSDSSTKNETATEQAVTQLKWRLQFQTSRRCRHVRRPGPEHLTITGDGWQRLGSEAEPQLYAARAFYDDRRVRGGLRTLRVFTSHRVMYPHPTYSCLVWYPGFKAPYIVEAIKYESTLRPRQMLNDFYRGYLYSCELPVETLVPEQVSLATDPCQTPKLLLNVTQAAQDVEQLDFGVCVTVSYGDLSAVEFVEWVEIHLALGVNEINIFDYNITSKEIRKAFRHYEDIGVLRVHKAPSILYQPIRRYSYMKMSMAYYLNECLYTNMYKYRHLIIVDIDEVIVPRQDPNYRTLIGRIQKHHNLHKLKGCLSFDNTYVSPNLTRDGPPFLNKLRRGLRALPGGALGKSFIDPMRCVIANNHVCFLQTLTSSEERLQVDPSLAMSYHYRRKSFSDHVPNITDDSTVWLTETISQRMKHVLRVAGLQEQVNASTVTGPKLHFT